VDGLRAVAVIAVILFHANEHWLPGGFAGVDIFFVISGFLISGQIARDFERGRFTFRNFYTRRIKRILPVYAVVSLAVSIASLYLLNTNDLTYFTTSLAASWLFVSNVFFALLSGGYFDIHVKLFPLLHTWSLGVEEQFYFIFPVLFVWLLRRQPARAIGIAAGLMAAFAVLSQLRAHAPSSYYLIQYRAHELLMGILAFLVGRDRPIVHVGAANALYAAGAALMLGSLVLLTPTSVYPGINSLYPCLGAALIIHSGQKARMFRPLLTNKPIVFVGLISYSMYLWHWPVFSLLQYRGVVLSTGVVMGAVAGIAAMSCLSWRFVEKPIRENRQIGFAAAFTWFFAVPASVFLAFGAVSYLSGGIPWRFSPQIRELMSSYSREATLPRACSQDVTSAYAEIAPDSLARTCILGDRAQKNVEILLFGDSHASHFKPFVDVLADNAHRKGVYHLMGSCPPLTPPDHEQASDALSPQALCARHNLNLLRLASHYRFVVVAGFWESVQPDLAEGLSREIDAIAAAGATPVIFRDSPSAGLDRSQCVLSRARGWVPSNTDCNIPYAEVLRRHQAENDIIDRIKARHPGTLVIDPREVLCSGTECLTEIDHLAVYRDSNHINEKAARDLAEKYIALEGNPFHR
jgi:peptidoglycan/LPS O-acetylase OafA/YrhL